MTAADRRAGMRFPAGTMVRLTWPDSPQCYRAGQIGTVRECIEHRRKDSLAFLHVVEFPTDVTSAAGVNLGRVPVFVMGHELQSA